MKKYFNKFIAYIITMLESEDSDFNKLGEEILRKISFMQHERLIHLIVLSLFAILFFICLTAFFISSNNGMLAASVLMLALLIPYIKHYYFLENNVQKLYSLYDEVKVKSADNK